MEFPQETIDGVVVLQLDFNEMGQKEANELRQTVHNIAADSDKLVLNMQNLTYCDSSGFGCLMICRSYLTSRQGKLSLCCLTSEVYKAFQLMRLDQVIECHDTIKEAVAAANID